MRRPGAGLLRREGDVRGAEFGFAGPVTPPIAWRNDWAIANFLDLTANALNFISAFTLVALFRVDALGHVDDRYIFAKGFGAGSSWSLRVTSSDTVVFRIGGTAAPAYTIIAGDVGKWILAVGTLDTSPAGTVRLRINGSEVGSGTGGVTSSNNTVEPAIGTDRGDGTNTEPATDIKIAAAAESGDTEASAGTIAAWFATVVDTALLGPAVEDHVWQVGDLETDIGTATTRSFTEVGTVTSGTDPSPTFATPGS